MQTTETARLFALLTTEYRKEVIDDDRIKIWTAVLKDVDFETAVNAVAEWIADPEKSRFFPKPGELRELCGADRPRWSLYGRYAQLRNADHDLTEEECHEFNRLDRAIFGGPVRSTAAAIGAG